MSMHESSVHLHTRSSQSASAESTHAREIEIHSKEETVPLATDVHARPVEPLSVSPIDVRRARAPAPTRARPCNRQHSAPTAGARSTGIRYGCTREPARPPFFAKNKRVPCVRARVVELRSASAPRAIDAHGREPRSSERGRGDCPARGGRSGNHCHRGAGEREER